MIDRDAWQKRPLSWSAISSFEYDPEQWYEKYVLGKKTTSREMTFGSEIGKKLETDPDYLPMVPRYGKDEYEFQAKLGGIRLVGFADSFDPVTCKRLGERKTGKKAWDQKRVNEHGQLTMYALLNQICNKVKPEEVEMSLAWLPTQTDDEFKIQFVEPIEENIQVFKTKRTTEDVRKFIIRIVKVYNSMKSYAYNHE